MNASTLSSSEIDITSDLLAVRRALKILLIQSTFREYLMQAILKGARNPLHEHDRDNRRHYTIFQVSDNGIDAPLNTFLVLSVLREAIGMPGFESTLKIHVRYTAEHDGFWKTRSVRSVNFRKKLTLCANPIFLKGHIRETFAE